MIIGLTGGIASGKSTVSSFFRELGANVVDADIVAREISEKKESVDRIAAIFGEDVVGNNGKIIREKVREKAFNNRELLHKLNGIIHPEVMEYFKIKKFENIAEKIMIFDIPLLYETKMEELCDKVIVVGLSRRKQIERVMLRDGSSKELANRIINSQMSLEEKMARADIVIMNEGTLEDLRERVSEVYQSFKREVNR